MKGSDSKRPEGTDDERWLAALAGRGERGQPSAAALEAGLLRAAVRRSSSAAPALSAERQRQLLAALEEVPAKGWRCNGCSRRWRALRQLLQRGSPFGRAPWALLAGGAVVAALVLGIGPLLRQPDADDDTVLRGAGSLSVQVLRVAEPQTSRDRLAAELAAQGAQVRRYARLGRFGLDAHWDGAPVPPAAIASLRAAGLEPPADAIVRAEFAAAQP